MGVSPITLILSYSPSPLLVGDTTLFVADTKQAQIDGQSGPKSPYLGQDRAANSTHSSVQPVPAHHLSPASRKSVVSPTPAGERGLGGEGPSNIQGVWRVPQ